MEKCQNFSTKETHEAVKQRLNSFIDKDVFTVEIC